MLKHQYSLLQFCIHLVTLKMLIYSQALNITNRHHHKSMIYEGFAHTALYGNGIFSKVLCIVYWNFAAPVDRVQLHHLLWSQSFPNMVSYGSWDHETFTALRKLHLPVLEIDCDTRNGHLAHRLILQAIDDFANDEVLFTGYMYFHDDMLLSPKKLGSLNQSVAWMARDIMTITLEPWDSRSFEWPWFNMEFGIPEMQRVMLNNPQISRRIEECYGTNHTWAYGQSDFLYIPASAISKLQYYLKLFQNIFVEIAVTMIMTCMIDSSLDYELELLPLCTTWSPQERPFPYYARRCMDYELIHPIKLNTADSIKITQDYIELHTIEGVHSSSPPLPHL